MNYATSYYKFVMTKTKLLVTHCTLITVRVECRRHKHGVLRLSATGLCCGPPGCKIFKELGLILESSDVKSGAGHVLTIKCGSKKDYEYHERSLYYPLQDIEAYTILLAVGVRVSPER
jgi:hypothetical protein